MDIIVRPFDTSDNAATIEIYYQAVHRGAADYYSTAQRNAWASRQIDAKTWCEKRFKLITFVAEIDGSVAGFIDLNEKSGLIDMLFVHPDSVRRGVATRLYETVLQIAVEARLMRLHSDASLVAKPFFQRHGFEVVEQQTVYRRGQELINFRMQKFLN